MPNTEQQYNQLKAEVTTLRTRWSKVGRHSFSVGVLVAALFLFLGWLDNVVLEGGNFTQWVHDYEWVELPLKALAWALPYYFWQFQRVKKRLRSKMSRLHTMLLHNHSLEKPLS